MAVREQTGRKPSRAVILVATQPGYPDRAPRFPKAAVRPPFGNFGVELGSLTTPDDWWNYRDLACAWVLLDPADCHPC